MGHAPPRWGRSPGCRRWPRVRGRSARGAVRERRPAAAPALAGRFLLAARDRADATLYACEDILAGGSATVRQYHLEAAAPGDDAAAKTLYATRLREHVLPAWQHDGALAAPDTCTYRCSDGYVFAVQDTAHQAVAWQCIPGEGGAR